MALDLSKLEAQIARDADVNSSAAALIVALVAEVQANLNDPAALQLIVDQYTANTDALAAAVAANTPAAASGFDLSHEANTGR